MPFQQKPPSLALALAVDATLLLGILTGCKGDSAPKVDLKADLVAKIGLLEDDIKCNAYTADTDTKLNDVRYATPTAKQKEKIGQMAKAEREFMSVTGQGEADLNLLYPDTLQMVTQSIRISAENVKNRTSVNQSLADLEASRKALCRLDQAAFGKTPDPETHACPGF